MVILVNSVGETGDNESSLISGVVSLLVSGCLEGLFASRDSKSIFQYYFSDNLEKKFS